MIGSTAGVLKKIYARSEFIPYLEDNLLNADKVIASGDTEITVRDAAGHNSVKESQEYKKCNRQAG